MTRGRTVNLWGFQSTVTVISWVNDERYVYNDQDLLCTDRSLLVVVGVQFLCVTFSISIHGVCYVTLVQFFLLFFL